MNLGCEVFQNGREVNRRTRANALSITAFLQEPGNPTDGELEAGLLRSGNGFGAFGFASAAAGGFD